jgi:hypothetical protein
MEYHFRGAYEVKILEIYPLIKMWPKCGKIESQSHAKPQQFPKMDCGSITKNRLHVTMTLDWMKIKKYGGTDC